MTHAGRGRGRHRGRLRLGRPVRHERRYNDTDTTLARLAIPSTYAPPCVPVWEGGRPWVAAGGETFTDNGGATAPGVTADTITVVFYVPAELDIAKQLEQFGVLDGEEATAAGVEGLVEMSNALYETYGRRVDLVPFHATGDGRSPSAARADAVRVVEMGAFASIGGPTQSSAYQHELARNGVLCIQCGYAVDRRRHGPGRPLRLGLPGHARPDPLRHDGVRRPVAVREPGAVRRRPRDAVPAPTLRHRPLRAGPAGVRPAEAGGGRLLRGAGPVGRHGHPVHPRPQHAERPGPGDRRDGSSATA